MNVQNNTLKIFISEHIDPKATPDEIKSLHNFNHSRSAEFDITPNGIRLKHFESDFAPGARKDEVECRVADNSIYIECAQLLHEFVLTDTNCKEEMIQFSLKWNPVKSLPANVDSVIEIKWLCTWPWSKQLAGETTLSFASIPLAKSNLTAGFVESSLKNQPFGIEIGFTTDQIAETVATALKAGATIVENPKTKPWGQTVAYLRDLDGFLIEICTPIG